MIHFKHFFLKKKNYNVHHHAIQLKSHWHQHCIYHHDRVKTKNFTAHIPLYIIYNLYYILYCVYI